MAWRVGCGLAVTAACGGAWPAPSEQHTGFDADSPSVQDAAPAAPNAVPGAAPDASPSPSAAPNEVGEVPFARGGAFEPATEGAIYSPFSPPPAPSPSITPSASADPSFAPARGSDGGVWGWSLGAFVLAVVVVFQTLRRLAAR